ncbi:MAG: hypothetical protein J7604_09990 [Sporocytophaga sp.]|uniref:hypothetical protein n=1 Tax=Sporocytophaga sp. TaxID=2231183 RepID=UPI001B18A4AC|nr:hypothetical protein [Sporocytophaga sp.]MBO9700527.1 hypothetical protein [Sporocytophaga sp.]
MSIRKIIFSVFILGFMFDHICLANMASPYRKGTLTGTAMTSNGIDILKEKIFILINIEDHTALYKVDYYIKCDSSGMQIPLLFYAVEYKDNFRVWLDDAEIKVEAIPESYIPNSNKPLNKIYMSLVGPGSKDYFKPYRNQELSEEMIVFNDFKYFETDLFKGAHHIHVEYTANASIELLEWEKKYSFKYFLYPAKFWRSFNSIEIAVKISNDDSDLKTNLGNPTLGTFDSAAIWKFDKLPADEIELSYKPQINLFGRALILVDPLGMTILFSIFISIWHYRRIKDYRVKEHEKKYSWVVIAGSIVLPFIILIWYIFTYEIIDAVIGPEASRYHGYTFLVIIFYPLIMPVYWIIMWQLDRRIKKKIIYSINQSL